MNKKFPPPGAGLAHSEIRIPLIEYQGQRAVTFAMVDESHQRPKGTARAAFNRNRDRFILGRHFYEPSPDVIRTMMLKGVFPRKTARGIVITERSQIELPGVNDE
ncbi:ORF6N domain-containing protein [Enterobacter mori]|uniref:ORF6N domain-containing protein n=1 Tax=Enterobacter mori TaxID=539813 RepID=UPI003B843635